MSAEAWTTPDVTNLGRAARDRPAPKRASSMVTQHQGTFVDDLTTLLMHIMRHWTLARPTVLPSYGSLGTRFVLPRLSLRVPEHSCLSLALAWRPYVDINTRRNLLSHGVCSIATAAALALLIAYNNTLVRLLVRPGANPSHASYRLQAPEALYRLYCGADALDVQDLDCWSSCTSRSGTILIVDMEIGGTGPRRSIAGAPDCNAAPTPLSWM
jgi:hypothetical protein